jgi:hypothetical protein
MSDKLLIPGGILIPSSVTGGKKRIPMPDKQVKFNYTQPILAANAASFYGLPIPVSAGQRALIGVPIFASPFRTPAATSPSGKKKKNRRAKGPSGGGGPSLTGPTPSIGAPGSWVPRLAGVPGPGLVPNSGGGAGGGGSPSGGGGGGGAVPAPVFCDFAISFGIESIPRDELASMQLLRLWFNETLILDNTVGSGWSAIAGLQYRVYEGTADQEPDPVVTFWLGDQNAIAFRNRIYIMFYNVNLTAFGLSAVPLVRAEFRDQLSTIAVVQPFTLIGATPSPSHNFHAVNWDSQMLYVTDRVSASELYVRSIDLLANTETFRVRVVQNDGTTVYTDSAIGPTGSATDVFYVDPFYGFLWMSEGSANSVAHDVVDPTTGYIVGRFGGDSSAIIDKPNSFTVPIRMTAVRANGEQFNESMVAVVGLFGQLGVLSVDPSGTPTYAWSGDNPQTLTTIMNVVAAASENIQRVCTGDLIQGVEAGSFFGATGRRVFRTVISPYAGGAKNTVDPASGQTFNSKWQGDTYTLWTAPTGHLIDEIFSDINVDDIVVLHHSTITTECFFTRLLLNTDIKGLVIPTDAGPYVTEVWTTTPVPDPAPTTRVQGWCYSNINGGATLGYANTTGGVVTIVNLMDGKWNNYAFTQWRLNTDTSLQGSNISVDLPQLWNGVGGILVGTGQGGSPQFDLSLIYVLSPPLGSLSLGQFLRWMALFIGFRDTDISITGISDVVFGSLIEKTGLNFWDMLADMSAAFRFQVFESEGKLKMVKFLRGGSLSVTAALPTPPDSVLLRTDGSNDIRTQDTVSSAMDSSFTLSSPNPCFTTTRDWTQSMPATVQLNYLDPDADYQVMVAQAKHTNFPVQSLAVGPLGTLNYDVQSYSVPIIMKPAQANGYAAMALYDLNKGRIVHEFRLPTYYLRLEPTDVLTLTINSNDYILMLTETTLNSDYSLTCASQSFGMADQIALVGTEPLTNTNSVIGPALSRFFTLDTPPIAPADGVISDASLSDYFLISSRGQTGWIGADLLSAPAKAGPYAVIAEQTDDVAVVGSVTVPLPYSPENTLDYTHSIITQLYINKAATLPSTGTILLGAQGRWELMTYATATNNGSGNWTLSQLVRGLRGTEMNVGNHKAGDTLISLDLSEYFLAKFPNAKPTDVLYLKAVGLNMSPSNVFPQTIAVGSNFVKPWGPSGFDVKKVGSDLVLSWNRRTRLSTDIVDSIDNVPNEYGTESYDLEILHDPTSASFTLTGYATGWQSGVPGFTSNQLVYSYTCVTSFTLPGGLSGSTGGLGTAATLATSFSIFKNGINVGAITFPLSSPSTAVFVFPGNVNFTPGDVLTIFAQPTPDTTATDLSFTFVGGNVARTVTGIGAPTYTYLSANMTSDFGSTPATLYFNVYQISPNVGRGFPGYAYAVDWHL